MWRGVRLSDAIAKTMRCVVCELCTDDVDKAVRKWMRNEALAGHDALSKMSSCQRTAHRLFNCFHTSA